MPAAVPAFIFLGNLPKDGAQRESLLSLLAAVLETSAADVAQDLRYQQARGPVQAWLAVAEGQLVGAKLGYERQPGHYYSWLGGVHPDFRGRGIAAELMRQQHAWCRQQGYQRIRTQTFNRWRAMLILNLRHGFDVIGTMQSPRGLTIMLEKELPPDALNSTQ